ncbi:unnamed protein product [Durusdinium trenchii]|uniref:Glycerophosphocholine acyltransferase 1 n=1 Tax=Durusdinium trenchii TaxID=1381693 RepID=A0ABP0MXA1_9DINO
MAPPENSKTKTALSLSSPEKSAPFSRQSSSESTRPVPQIQASQVSGLTGLQSSEGWPMDIVTQFLATCMVLNRSWAEKDLLLFGVYHLLELMSFFSVTYLAQWTSHWCLVFILMAMYALAAHRARDWRVPFRRPIYMFLPEQHSCFGLCHSQRSASIYQWISASLRMGSLAVWVLMVPNFHDEPMCASPLIPFEDDACGEMPSWLRPGCGTFFSPSKWQKCMSVSWAYGYCNLLAAQCRNQALGSVNLLISIFFSSSLSLISFLSPCLWLGGALYFHHTGTQIFNIPKALELETSIREEEILLAAGDPKAEQLGPWMIRAWPSRCGALGRSVYV